MRILLIAMAILVTAGFVYFNHYQNEMMMAAMEANQPDPELEALAAELKAAGTVFVLITDESQEAVYNAVVENPGKTVFELGVSTEDRLHEIEVPSQDGQTTQRGSALIVFTREDAVWNEVSFRTDVPLYVLDHVRNHPDIHYVVLNPPTETTEHVPESIVLDPREISALYWRLK